MSGAAETWDSNKLVVAARKGRLEVVAELLHADGTDANVVVACEKVPTMDGATALCWAARQGQIGAVKLLLAAGADVNAMTRSEWTALYVAALNGHAEIVEILLSQGADVAAAMSLGDERTNRNLMRMVAEAKESVAVAAAPQSRPLPPAAPPPAVPPPAGMAEEDRKAITRPSGSARAELRKTAFTTVSTSVAGSPAVAGMNELDAMKLRLEWRAPPTEEEERSAENARQTVFKYRHDRIRELEEAIASGTPLATRDPAVTVAQPAPAATAAVPVAPAAPSGDMSGGADHTSHAALLARLSQVEARLAETGTLYQDGYAKGFAEGFAAGRASEP